MGKIDKREKTEKIMKKQEEVFLESEQLLQKNKRCLILLPTGMGKTFLAFQLMQKYKKVIFFYPSDLIRSETERKYVEQMEDKEKVLSMSYMALALLEKVDLKKKECFQDMNSEDCLFVFDEAHRMAGQKTYKVIERLMEAFPNAHYLGMTATPFRPDGIDIIQHFFYGSTTKLYTLGDAVRDSIFQEPIYMYSTIYVVEHINQKMEEIKHLKYMSATQKKYVLQTLSQKRIEYAKLMLPENTIREAVELAEIDPSYMNFIVFMPNIYSLASKKEEVVQWFQKAYPDHKIRTYTVTGKEREDMKNIPLLTPVPNTIDLIFNVLILTMGYHVQYITGVVLVRHTDSDIMASQMIGRIFSVESDNTGIILDMVGNDHVGNYFGMAIDKKRKISGSGLDRDVMDFSKEEVRIINHVKQFKEIDRFCFQEQKKAEKTDLIHAFRSMIMDDKEENPPLSYLRMRLELATDADTIEFMEQAGCDMSFYKGGQS